nr:MAG TPA: hypothetical protein [Caudoviricetes sp.]
MHNMYRKNIRFMLANHSVCCIFEVINFNL